MSYEWGSGCEVNLFFIESREEDTSDECFGEEFDFEESDSSMDGEGIDIDVSEDFDIELQAFEEWASSPNAFKAVSLSDEEFRAYYYDRNWNLNHVKLRGPINNSQANEWWFVRDASWSEANTRCI